MRLFERALRRAQIPIGMSKGFNPRPKLSFPLALQLGIEAFEEIMELELCEWMKPAELLERLECQLPDGIDINLPEVIAPNQKSRVSRFTYKMSFAIENLPITQSINRLMASEIINVTRIKGRDEKIVNIRQSILNIEKEEDGILVQIDATCSGTAKPSDVVDALGIDERVLPLPIRITRTQVDLL